ncbi:MAG TPA: nucleotidyltransferase family protein [Saprospiraceae bacterium]|nr:nucleotidyltransferase family protein [Saprospiraceae bacterium]
MRHKTFGKISLILLAAGESSRLGTPKQLLMYKGKNLMQHTIDFAQTLGMETVIVLGAFKEEILAEVDVLGIEVVENVAWSEGLASSIRCGLRNVLETNPETEAVILVLCDQPFLTTEILREVVEKYHSSGQSIVHCSYGEVSGPPTLFHKSLFPYLMELKGGQGAKKVLDMFPNQVAYVDFPKGKLDIDTAADYHQLLQTESDT